MRTLLVISVLLVELASSENVGGDIPGHENSNRCQQHDSKCTEQPQVSRGAEDSNHITSHGSVGWTAVAKSSSNPIASSVAIPTSVQRFFNPDNLVLTTSRPLLSEFECGELRKEYEAQQVELQKQKGFGGAYSDLGFDQSAGLQQIWENLRPRALSAIAAAYPKAVESVADLVVLSSQLIKYNRSAGVAEAKNEHGSYSPVRQHVDPSWISLNIAFNSRSEYNGGGVWFPSLGLDATMIDEGSAVVHPGFVNHQSAPLKKGVRYGLQVWVNVSSYTQFHRTAYADGEEASFRRSATRAVMEGWDASTTFELQYRLAMSLVGQLSFSKGTLHGLDKYVECKRLMDHIAAYANASSEWWKSESDELLTVISGMQEHAVDSATMELIRIPEYSNAENVARELGHAAWWELLQVSLQASNKMVKALDFTGAEEELRHVLSWHALKVGSMPIPAWADQDLIEIPIDGDEDLTLLSWSWCAQRSALEARFAYILLQNDDRRSALIHYWESLALAPTNYRTAVTLFELTSVPLPAWHPDDSDEWMQVTGHSHGKASSYQWKMCADKKAHSKLPDTIVVAALGYQLKRHRSVGHLSLWYDKALNAYRRALKYDLEVENYLRNVAHELQQYVGHLIDEEKFTTAHDMLARAKVIHQEL